MTKLRPALSFADAMTRVAGVIGWEAACALVGKKDRTVRAWSEPDRQAVPSIAEALALDAAYRFAGGDGAPFHEAFAHQLDVTVANASACDRALVADAALVAREVGDAVAAGLKITQPDATPLDTLRAIAEADEAEKAVRAYTRRLASFLPDGGVPGAGKIGGTPS